HSSARTQATPAAAAGAAGRAAGAYAAVNGLRMYYETSGSGEALVLLHRAFLTVGSRGSLLPATPPHRRRSAADRPGRRAPAAADRAPGFGPRADGVAALRREIKVRSPTSSATAWEARSAAPSRSGTPTSCGLKASQGRPLGRARSEDERPQLDTAAVAEMGTAHRQFQGLGTVAGPQHEEAQWLFGPLGRHR